MSEAILAFCVIELIWIGPTASKKQNPIIEALGIILNDNQDHFQWHLDTVFVWRKHVFSRQKGAINDYYMVDMTYLTLSSF